MRFLPTVVPAETGTQGATLATVLDLARRRGLSKPGRSLARRRTPALAGTIDKLGPVLCLADPWVPAFAGTTLQKSET